jgi:hypothetical protein
MLLGKLATPATKVIQNGLTVESIPAEYMTISAHNYVIGTPHVSFEVRFGNIVIENEKERFDIVLRHGAKMTLDELSTWGTDDSILFDLLAEKFNMSITEKITKDFTQTY